MKFRSRTFTVLVTLFAIAYVSIFVVLIQRYRTEAYNHAADKVVVAGEKSISEVETSLYQDYATARGLAHTMLSRHNISPSNYWDHYAELLDNVFNKNREYLGVWFSFEYKSFLPGYTKDYGRRLVAVQNVNGKKEPIWLERNLQGDDLGSTYYAVKQFKKEVLVEPYWYSVTQDDKNMQLISTITIPA